MIKIKALCHGAEDMLYIPKVSPDSGLHFGI